MNVESMLNEDDNNGSHAVRPYISRNESSDNSQSDIANAALPKNYSYNYSIELYNFDRHYKSMMKLSTKYLNVGPDTLPPIVFILDDHIKCIVATENKYDNDYISNMSYDDHGIEMHSKCKVIGFVISYLHPHCRPYHEHAFQIGFLGTDIRKIQKHGLNNNDIISDMLLHMYDLIHPSLLKTIDFQQKKDKNGKIYLAFPNNYDNGDINDVNGSNDNMNGDKSYPFGKLGQKPNESHAIAIYAPVYHVAAQRLYENVGFIKIAKISQYYAYDTNVLENIFDDITKKNNDDDKYTSDAFLYCKTTDANFKQCRLMLALEYFNYKKWPKFENINVGSGENVEIEVKEQEENDHETESNTDNNKKRKKRTDIPKIVEEYIQKHIVQKRKEEKEKARELEMKKKMNLFSQVNSTNPYSNRYHLPSIPQKIQHVVPLATKDNDNNDHKINININDKKSKLNHHNINVDVGDDGHGYASQPPLIGWLCSHDLLQISQILLNAQITIDILATLKESELNQLCDELHLPILQKFKFKNAVNGLELQIAHIDDNNDNNDDNEDNDDSKSVASDVSTISSPYQLKRPLVVIIGIGIYRGMANLDGIGKDYDNFINTFVNSWNYKVLYKLEDNKCIYTNNSNEIKKNYKLDWNGGEIEEFIEQARRCIVKNRHDGLLFAISSHGDTGKILYDSDCEKYELDFLFGMYSSHGSQLLETYKETSQETEYLLTIPKIFFLDMCRGDSKAEVTVLSKWNINKSRNGATGEDDDENKNKNKNGNKNNNNDNNKYDLDTEENENEQKYESKLDIDDNDNYNNNIMAVKQLKFEDIKLELPVNTPKLDTVDEEFQFKNMSKEEAYRVVAQMANFCKLYANIEGYSVADGTVNGGVFLRNVCRVFKDRKFVLKHYWTQLIFKIREYTKRDATIAGTLVNFTQLVENEGTLEQPVVFRINKDSHLFATQWDPMLDEKQYQEKDEQEETSAAVVVDDDEIVNDD